MDERLARALDIVLRDVPAEVVLDVRDDNWASSPAVGAVIWDAEGSGSGVYIDASDSFVFALATVADQVQEIVLEAQWDARVPVGWPRCNRHPGTHPLEAAVVGVEAV